MLLTGITFFIILSILILIHELGHFFVARWIGVDVEEFGFGLPPRIVGKKFGKVLYSLNWLPIGGFVKLAGEDEEEKSIKQQIGLTQKNSKHFFWGRTKKERAAILVAGVVMNFLLAVGISTYLLTQGVPTPMGKVYIKEIVQNSPADVSGLKPGDIIERIREAKSTPDVNPPLERVIIVPNDLISFVNKQKGNTVILTAVRGESRFEVQAVPRVDPPSGQGALGVAITDLVEKRYPLIEAPFAALSINIKRIGIMLRSLGGPIIKLLTFQSVCGDVSGPIGIAKVTGQAVKFGFLAVLELMSILSLNLAILNILPFPALDGGRLAFVFLEKFMGRRIRPVYENAAHRFGMITLLILMVLISINDIFCRTSPLP